MYVRHLKLIYCVSKRATTVSKFALKLCTQTSLNVCGILARTPQAHPSSLLSLRLSVNNRHNNNIFSSKWFIKEQVRVFRGNSKNPNFSESLQTQHSTDSPVYSFPY